MIIEPATGAVRSHDVPSSDDVTYSLVKSRSRLNVRPAIPLTASGWGQDSRHTWPHRHTHTHAPTVYTRTLNGLTRGKDPNKQREKSGK